MKGWRNHRTVEQGLALEELRRGAALQEAGAGGAHAQLAIKVLQKHAMARITTAMATLMKASASRKAAG